MCYNKCVTLTFLTMNPGIFKAYDIRGIYPDDINEDDAYNIGWAVVAHLAPKRLGIGRDIRQSSPSLFKSFTQGVMDAGCDVLDLGIITTPMVYFAAGRLDIDAAISLTASHNPPQYNGMKIVLRGAIPVGENSGLQEIRDLALRGERKDAERKGAMTTEDICPAYFGFFTSFADFQDKHFTIAIDTANAMGVLELPIYEQFPDNLSIVNLYNDMEHAFECHEANPLKTETLAELQEKVKESEADLGIAYDGDADRVGFVDEQGMVIPMDLVTALLAKTILKRRSGVTILYHTTFPFLHKIIEENGGIATECPIASPQMKKQMHEENAVFGSSGTGGYYFEENSFAEAPTLAAIFLLNTMATADLPISKLVEVVHPSNT